MKFVLPWLLGMLLSVCRLHWDPFPAPGGNPFLDLIALNDPTLYYLIAGGYYLTPWIAAGVGGALLLSAWQVWFSNSSTDRRRRGSLPSWPVSSDLPSLSLVVGETHHLTEPVESDKPSWLVMSEKGLFTGVAVVGAVGTGKTSACMHPFARQLFSWQASDPGRKCAGLVLEVKGDFCHQINDILRNARRGGDYLEIGLGGQWQWNPLHAPWMDSYSLAYTIAGLMNQLFGKSREPFWQMAAMNLVRNIIELYQLQHGWVTLRDVYRAAIDSKRLDTDIRRTRQLLDPDNLSRPRVQIHQKHILEHKEELGRWTWSQHGGQQVSTPFDKELSALLVKLGVDFQKVEPSPPHERLERLLAVERWYSNDWCQIDNKLKTSIIEGISVFLGLFDTPEVARVFCPAMPQQRVKNKEPEDPLAAISGNGKTPSIRPAGISTLQPLPSLEHLIESGKVLCLNMPVSANPALARAIGVMLKQSWLQALLRRPSEIRQSPDRYFRPAVFLCDEYQAFATVGESDPCGDEKAFALSRQSRCIPIVATQSISSLRSVTGSGEAWRTLLQTLRTKIFLSLSDDSSARIASDMCGQVERLKASYSYNESHARAGVSLFSGAPGSGKSSLGASKSYQARMEPLFRPKIFAELDTCQAVILPYDGKRNLPAQRVYLKPFFLPRDSGYFRQREKGLL